MIALRVTLLGDGSSDKALIPILEWLLQSKLRTEILSPVQWAYLGYRRDRPDTLEKKIRYAVEDYPCDLLFVHRDAESQSPEARRTEIRHAVAEAGIELSHVCVIPVRMTEAWLLLDEKAIRSAAGNPNGTVGLNLPDPRRVEDSPDPKEDLFRALRAASELSGRRLHSLRVDERRHRVAELLDYQLLGSVPAFQALEEELAATLAANGWE